MRSFAGGKSWPQGLLRAWAIAWMLAIPAFHVHPTVDQHVGGAKHIHGGTIHTVYSSNLDFEHNDHHKTAGVGHASLSHDDLLVHPAHVADDSEITFIFLIDTSEQPLPKPIGSHLLVVDCTVSIAPAPVSPFVRCNESPPHQTLVLQYIPTRAPPSLLI